MIIANGKGRVSTLAVDDDLDMNGRNVTNADVVSVNDHVTLVGAQRFPGKGFRSNERNGWYVSKDNNDIERKFIKDPLDVDSSDMWLGTQTGFAWTGSVLSWDGSTRTNIFRSDSGSIQDKKIECEVRTDSLDGTGYIGVVVGDTASNKEYRIAVRCLATGVRKLYIHKNYGGTVIGTSSADIPEADFAIGTWYHMTVTITTAGVITATIICNGVTYTATATDTTVTERYCGVHGDGATNNCSFRDFTVSPSVSYADDFATDTTERYQAVTGTVAYDDANKRMNVTTATGANGKASGRLKSYKFCEGAQQFDVTLPVGADGDFICMVTHAANSAMNNGIGVGLQSDGAGNWNLATLSNTTVTEGADSGLDDADVARIEIEKDITGAYWYYIYDAAGAKPTTATGKLFTTLSEGYTGWYANGAGATTQTYAIDNISIRAESIMGRTNVEVTEDVFNSVTGEIESRTYFKPIHRGAMLETYHDGTQEVVGTTFIDDCQWDRSAEYIDIGESTQFDTVNGYLVCTGAWKGKFIRGLSCGDLDITVDVYNSSIDGGWEIVLCSDNNDFSITTGNKLMFRLATDGATNNLILSKTIGGVYSNLGSVEDSVVATWRTVRILKIGSTVKMFVNNLLIKTVTGVDLLTGGIGFGTYSPLAGEVRYKNIQIIAASPDATNGIAACIPPIGGGARYGVQEEVYHTYTNEVRKGKYLVSTCVKTTNADADAIEMYLENTTDSTAITEDDSKTVVIALTDTNYMDVEKEMELGYADRGDTLKVAVRKTDAATEVSPACYVEMLNVTPTVEVI